jgi:single-strand selective monofunctional uracil DNA glycosylase
MFSIFCSADHQSRSSTQYWSMTATATKIRRQIIKASRSLCDAVDEFAFGDPVTHVYNPLRYARAAHEAYLARVNEAGVRVVFLGMNPGPWGMAQTGVPFGEINAVRDWIGIDVEVDRPHDEHPKRPVEGFRCQRSEVSGRRLWGLMAERFNSSDEFFRDHFITNYCPLVFMEQSGRNRTPDKLALEEREPLNEACDRHLQSVLKVLRPEIVVAVGGFAQQCLQRSLDTGCCDARLTRILHPSPASPAANKDWAGTATRQLIDGGVW